MAARSFFTLAGRSRRLAPGFAVAALVAVPAVAQVTNGGFESGNLTGWTLGGTSRAEALRATNLTPNIAPPEGIWFALLSTGRGQISAAARGDLDGNNSNDFDVATLSTTITVASVPQALAFRWAMLTSEVGRAALYDDFFKVTLAGGVGLARSVYKPGGGSSYSDSPAYSGTSTTVSSTGVTNTSLFAQGATPFQQACVVITTPGTYTLEFLLADQGDTANDSGLLLDDVAFPSSCGTAVGQVTSTVGSDLEVKAGGFTFTATESRDVATSNSGAVAALVSNGNLTGDNPNAQTQLFVWTGGAFSRVTSAVDADVGRPSLTSNGQWIAFASTGDLTPASPGNADRNWEIFRFDRATSTLLQVTDTAGCANTAPSIALDAGGSYIAFATTCPGQAGGGYNADLNPEVVLWNNGAFSGRETSGCASVAPSIDSGAGRYVYMVTSCAYPGVVNADGNNEIVRWDRQTSTYLQITNTAATVVNDVPSASGDGLAVGFLSSGDLSGGNADGSLEVFRWRSTTPNLLQLTNAGATVAHTWVTAEDAARYFAAERLDTTSFLFDTLLIDANGPTALVLSSSSSFSFPAVARNGTTPLVHFQSNDDLAGGNADGNSEVFTSLGGSVPRASYCLSPNLAIPNNNPAGVSSTMAIADSWAIADLELFLRINHTQVGDLIVTLLHVDTGTSVRLVDRPGVPATAAGCSGDNIVAMIDDEAVRAVEGQCVTATPPAIWGVFRPNNLASAFDGQSLAGSWRLTVSDNRNVNTGTLVQWCLSVDGS